MLMNIEKIWGHKKQLKAVTGLTHSEARELIKDFEEELKNTNSKPKISNPNDAGRNRKLQSRELFVMVLMFYRHYQTIDFVAAMFDLSPSNVKRWIDDSEKALRAVLAKKNFSHLIAQNRKEKSRKPLNNTEKSILMALNNLSEGRVTT